MRLENGDDPPVRPPQAERGEPGRDLGWVMGIVVHDQVAVLLEDLQPAARPCGRGEREHEVAEGDVEEDAGRKSAERIAHVVRARAGDLDLPCLVPPQEELEVRSLPVVLHAHRPQVCVRREPVRERPVL